MAFKFRYVFVSITGVVIYIAVKDYPALNPSSTHFCTERNEHAERRANRNHSQSFSVHL